MSFTTFTVTWKMRLSGVMNVKKKKTFLWYFRTDKCSTALHVLAPVCHFTLLSFELIFFVCRHVSIWGFQNRVRLSVCTPWKERHSCRFQHISVLTTCLFNSSLHHWTFILYMTSGMHRRLFEGWHLVFYFDFVKSTFMSVNPWNKIIRFSYMIIHLKLMNWE